MTRKIFCSDQLRNTSGGINIHAGVERVDNHVSIPDSWMDFSHRNIQASQAARYRGTRRRRIMILIMMTMLLITIMMMARSATQRLMGEVDNLVTQCANEMWSHWSNTNMSFQQRIKVPSARYY